MHTIFIFIVGIYAQWVTKFLIIGRLEQMLKPITVAVPSTGVHFYLYPQWNHQFNPTLITYQTKHRCFSLVTNLPYCHPVLVDPGWSPFSSFDYSLSNEGWSSESSRSSACLGCDFRSYHLMCSSFWLNKLFCCILLLILFSGFLIFSLIKYFPNGFDINPWQPLSTFPWLVLIFIHSRYNYYF